MSENFVLQQEQARRCTLAFCASTGRTATMFIAKTLNDLPEVVATHEGHIVRDGRHPVLPLVNLHNRKAWRDQEFAARTAMVVRSSEILSKAAGDASVFVDIAFNNAPFLDPLAVQHPAAKFMLIFRRCEDFVRSATIVEGEDMQPAGWPDRSKPLTDRERFIELGRLKPLGDSEFGELWETWSAIQRNIWLWTAVNSHLLSFADRTDAATKLFFEDLATDSIKFWRTCLGAIGQASTENIEVCVAQSARKTNQRSRYQIGPVKDWNDAERLLHEKLALPLEGKIYG